MVLLVVMSTYGGRTKPFPWIEVVRKQQQDVQLDNVVKVREEGWLGLARLQQGNLIKVEASSLQEQGADLVQAVNGKQIKVNTASSYPVGMYGGV